MIISAAEIAEAVGGRIISGNPESMVKDIFTDSNAVTAGSLFVPIIGARVDGHRFIQDAINHGASASFTSREDIGIPAGREGMSGSSKSKDIGIPAGHEGAAALILVNDTRTALQELGHYCREKYIHCRYIGVTGSVGKTTTREMIAAALGGSFKVYSTKGNANSQVGVPITVFNTDERAEAGIIEMGMSEFGEMERISRVACCDMAVFTVIGVSHISQLKTKENIMSEKLRIAEYMRENGILLLNGDDELLAGIDEERLHGYGICLNKHVDIRFYGTGDNARYKAVNTVLEPDGAEYDFAADGRVLTHVKVNISGRHMLMDSLAAMSVAFIEGADLEKAADGLYKFRSLGGRGEVAEFNGIKIINDAYNAAPQSMREGLAALNGRAARAKDCAEPDGIETHGRLMAVIADMLELGDDERLYHAETGISVYREFSNIDILALYGELMLEAFKGAVESCKAAGCDIEPDYGDGYILQRNNGRPLYIRHFDSLDAISDYVKSEAKSGDVIFFKGSNSMKLWRLANEMGGKNPAT